MIDTDALRDHADKQLCNEAADEIERLRDEVAKLRAALAPFARAERIVSNINHAGPPHMVLYYSTTAADTFSLNALANAKEAMR